ncbi:hypothetical protein [Fusobacterium mortiferum]|uniref:Uncharacterized protein n=1 Tax=Fusobacterium mortiferum TaxID=850 RepID=A0ABS2G655_FUSMR|nr:hypothetical protein [Fusobacterium mortiferum]MBM6876205.1 hypothetical protein [Fusobacterium mortiferum]
MEKFEKIILEKANWTAWANNMIVEIFKFIRQGNVEELNKLLYMIQSLRSFELLNDKVAIILEINVENAIKMVTDKDFEIYSFKTFTDDESGEYLFNQVVIEIPRSEFKRGNQKLIMVKQIYITAETLNNIKKDFAVREWE